jgi:uncharacterized beta-barrel protein YwiB (DUF1934 family)
MGSGNLLHQQENTLLYVEGKEISFIVCGKIREEMNFVLDKEGGED